MVQIVTVENPNEVLRVFDPNKVNYFFQTPDGEREYTHCSPFKIICNQDPETGDTRRLYVCLGKVWDSGKNEIHDPPEWFWEQIEGMLKLNPKCFDGYGGAPKKVKRDGSKNTNG